MFLYNILTDLYGLSLFLKPRVSDFFHVPKRKKINVWFIVEEKQIDNFFFVITIFLFCLLLLFSNMLFSVFVFIKMNTGSSWVNADFPSIFQKNLYLHLFKCETVSCYEDIFIFKSCYKPNKFLLHFHVLDAVCNLSHSHSSYTEPFSNWIALYSMLTCASWPNCERKKSISRQVEVLKYILISLFQFAQIWIFNLPEICT